MQGSWEKAGLTGRTDIALVFIEYLPILRTLSAMLIYYKGIFILEKETGGYLRGFTAIRLTGVAVSPRREFFSHWTGFPRRDHGARRATGQWSSQSTHYRVRSFINFGQWSLRTDRSPWTGLPKIPERDTWTGNVWELWMKCSFDVNIG